MSLNTQDKKYIEDSFERFSLRFNDDMERHTGVLKEDFQHKMDTVIEILNDKPSRGEFNELKDEVSGIHREIGIFQLNLKDHERRIGKLEVVRR